MYTSKKSWEHDSEGSVGYLPGSNESIPKIRFLMHLGKEADEGWVKMEEYSCGNDKADYSKFGRLAVVCCGLNHSEQQFGTIPDGRFVEIDTGGIN